MMPQISSPGRTRLMGIALLVITFLAGGISGAAVERRANAATPIDPGERVPGPAVGEEPEDRKRESRGRLIDQVGLSEEQRAAIDSILQEGREKVDAYWNDWEPGYRALVDSTRARVRGVLTPEQLKEYDRLRAEHRNRTRSSAEPNDNDRPIGSKGKSGKERAGTGTLLSQLEAAVRKDNCGESGPARESIRSRRAESKECKTE